MCDVARLLRPARETLHGQVCRLFEDLAEILPSVSEPMPDDIAWHLRTQASHRSRKWDWQDFAARCPTERNRSVSRGTAVGPKFAESMQGRVDPRVCLRADYSSTPGASHGLRLTQHRLPAMPDDRYLRGRLYLDGVLIERRSDAELTLLDGLRRAPIIVGSETPSAPPAAGPHLIVGDDIKAFRDSVQAGPAAAMSHLVCELIAFVESDEYLQFGD